MGIPDQSEATDLVRHVDRCAMRYRLFTSRLRVQSSAIRRIEFLLYGLAAFILATSHPAQELLQFLASLK